MTIYIDDSGTSAENAVAVAAGWIAHTDRCVDFQADWDKARDVDGDKFDSMHMAEFVFGRRGTEFEGWSLEKKQRISARLRGIIKNTAEKGFALGIVKKVFDELVPSALRVQGFESHSSLFPDRHNENSFFVEAPRKIFAHLLSFHHPPARASNKGVFLVSDFGADGFSSKGRHGIHPIKSTSSHTGTKSYCAAL